MIDRKLRRQIAYEYCKEVGMKANALTNQRMKLPYIASTLGFFVAHGHLTQKQKDAVFNTVYGRKMK